MSLVPRLPLTGSLVACLLGAGCASLQQPAAPPPADPTPLRWHAAVPAPEVLSDAGWAALGDPALVPLITQALQAGTDVAAAQARLRQARAARDGAAAGLRPSLGGSGSAQGSWSDRGGGAQGWRAGLDASWELDLWGAGRAGLQAAEAGVRASELTLAHTRVVVAAEVAATLLELRGLQARRAIAERSLASQRQTLQIVQWRHEAGLVTALDVQQARTAVEQLRVQVPALAGSEAQAMNALAVLAGQAPGALAAPLAVRAGEAPAPPAVAAMFAPAVPAEVLRRRPDVQAAERQLAAAAARVAQADAGRLPSLSLGGSIGLSAASLAGLGSGAGVASLLAGVSLPVLDFGRRQAQVRQQEAARDEAAVAWRATVLAALQEVEDALVALSAVREQFAAQQAAAASAQQAAELAEQRYRSGLVDFQNVLQSQRTLLSAQDSVASLRTALAIQQVRLYKALGGGGAPELADLSAR